ncbi:MAG: glycine zipper domain-containing protein [Pseudobdellovibrionaceae bacterium]
MSNSTNDFSSKANGMAQDFKNKIQKTEDHLEKMSHDIGEKMGAKASRLAMTTSDYVTSGREYVQANPIKGIAIAAVTGIALGSLLTLALRRR